MSTVPKRHDSLFKRSKSTDVYPTNSLKLDPINFNHHLSIYHTSSPTSIIDSSQSWLNDKSVNAISPNKSPNTYLPPRSSSLSNPISHDYFTIKPVEEEENKNHTLPELKRSTALTVESLEDAISTCSSYLTHTDELLLSPPKSPLKDINHHHHNTHHHHNDLDDIDHIELNNNQPLKVDEEVEESLLDWKRMSNQALASSLSLSLKHNSEKKNDHDILLSPVSANFNNHLSNMFSNTTELWNEFTIFGDIESILKKPTLQDQCQQTAEHLWNHNEQFISKKDMASFLGKNNLFNHTVLQLYLAKFDFTSLRLDDAFRLLCTKLYFKAEAQEIDRVLEGFAYRYWCCNRDSTLLYNPDIVYAVIYSLMLLNTDLHIAQGLHHTKMSRADFILNTMTTINNNKYNNQSNDNHRVENWNQSMELYLKELYTSVKLHGILQPGSEKLTRGKSLLQRMGSKRQISQRRGSELQQQQQNDLSVTKNNNNNDYSVGGNIRKLSHDIIDSPVMEGKIRYKTNDSKIKLPNKHEWNEAWMVLYQRCLSLIADKSSIIPHRSMIRQTNQAWELLDLGHSTTARGTISTTIANTTKNNVFHFHLILNNSIWYEFECETESELNLWIKHIQYWTAMSTRIPLKPPISSDRFGWENDLIHNYHLLNSCTISTWESPHSSPSIIASSSSFSFHSFSIDEIKNQRLSIKEHLASLQEEHKYHSTLFSPINQIPIVYHNSKTLILSNWHEKNNYLIQEIEKYVLYNNSIQEYQQPNILDPSYSIGSFNLLDEISDSLKFLTVE
ncbi:unnamed protein product [Cunninghamella blakesleeana]